MIIGIFQNRKSSLLHVIILLVASSKCGTIYIPQAISLIAIEQHKQRKPTPSCVLCYSAWRYSHKDPFRASILQSKRTIAQLSMRVCADILHVVMFTFTMIDNFLQTPTPSLLIWKKHFIQRVLRFN